MSLRIGVAGLGRGMGFVRVFSHHAECELAAVCDVQPGRAAKVAEEFEVPMAFEDYSELCRADIDAIVVATPLPIHVPCAVEAMEHGKHVLSEVPAANDLDQAEQLARAVEQSGLKYMFAENMCYYAYMETYDNLVKRGDIGKPIYVEAEYIHDCRSLMHDRFDGITPGSESGLTWRASLPPIHYCTHDLGPALDILDTRVTTACGMHTGSNVAPELGAIDMEVGIFQTECGAVIKILAGFSIARHPAMHWMVIYGTEGYIEGPRGGRPGPHHMWTENIPNITGPIEIPAGASHTNAPPEATLGGHGTSEYFMCNDFVRCILDDTAPAIDVYRGLDYTVPGICAHISAENGGEPVEVPDYRQR
ncbi:MAG: Gfo/Idh/MocA family oxidoreductase [Armatimonadetes bacterium]|nr:Gfo/Idh/MocA family oxidoreductase [Armatimonadota bacterium]